MFPFEKDGFSTYCVTWLLHDTLAAPEKNTCKLQSSLPPHIPGAIPRVLPASYWQQKIRIHLKDKNLNPWKSFESSISTVPVHWLLPQKTGVQFGHRPRRTTWWRRFVLHLCCVAGISRWTSLGGNWRMSTFFGGLGDQKHNGSMVLEVVLFGKYITVHNKWYVAYVRFKPHLFTMLIVSLSDSPTPSAAICM